MRLSSRPFFSTGAMTPRCSRPCMVSWPKPTLPAFWRVADDEIAFRGHLILGHDVIGTLVIAGIDLVSIDELHHVDGFLAFEPDCLDLLWIHHHIDIWLYLVSLDNVAALNASNTRHHLFVFDALAAGFVNLIELNLSPALGRG